MEKKQYTTPSVTKYGNIVKETKGYGGVTWEFQGLASWIDFSKTAKNKGA